MCTYLRFSLVFSKAYAIVIVFVGKVDEEGNFYEVHRFLKNSVEVNAYQSFQITPFLASTWIFIFEIDNFEKTKLYSWLILITPIFIKYTQTSKKYFLKNWSLWN